MRYLFFVLLLSFGTHVLAQNTVELDPNLRELVPAGYRVTDKIYGDLNKDNQDDVVLIIKATDKTKMVTDEIRGTLDLNRRGIIVALKNQQKYDTVIENRHCFHSEDEQSAYFAPDIDISIESGNLHIYFLHGRYGYWAYNFRGSDFELIGYDASANRGPVVKTITGINYLTKKKLVKHNINAQDEEAEPVFKEQWTRFKLNHRFKLSEIDNFAEFGTGLSE